MLLSMRAHCKSKGSAGMSFSCSMNTTGVVEQSAPPTMNIESTGMWKSRGFLDLSVIEIFHSPFAFRQETGLSMHLSLSTFPVSFLTATSSLMYVATRNIKKNLHYKLRRIFATSARIVPHSATDGDMILSASSPFSGRKGFKVPHPFPGMTTNLVNASKA